MNDYSCRAMPQVSNAYALEHRPRTSKLKKRVEEECIFVSTTVKIKQIAPAFALNLDGQIHPTNQEPRQSTVVGQYRSVASLRPCQQACKLDRQPLKMRQPAKSIELLLMDADQLLGYRP